MKKIFIIAIMLIIAILAIGFTTNPSYAEYKEWYKQQAQEGLKEYKINNNEDVVETTQFENSLMGFFTDVISDTSVVREDYKLYSVYKIDTESYKYKVLGVFNNFYVLEDVKIANEESQE